MRLLFRFTCGLRLAMLLAGVLLAFTAVSSSQSSDPPSLGELARKQRQKQQQTKDTSAKPKKVVTDEDMPEHPEASADSASADAPHSDGPHGEISVQPSAGDVLKTGDQWKTAIARQKGTIADLKTRIDKLSSSIRFVTANAYRNGVEYNKYQAQKEQEVQRLQGELDGQKRDLEQMQESARKAGYGSAVWDP